MKRVPLAGVMIVMLAGGLRADDTDSNQPPERSVARISVINGEVSVRRGDSGDVLAAAINAPLLVQDSVLTSSSSRAEIQFDSANILRVASNSEVRLGDLQFRRYQIQVALGTVTFRVLRNSDAQVEVNTPISSLRPLGRGTYRITVREDGSAELTVRDGEAEVSTSRGTEHLRAGATMLLRGSQQDPEFQIVAEVGPDEWDHWNSNRDQDFERARSPQYVSSDIYGTEDLDAHGRWVNEPSYGNVWVPTVEPGWAPYRSGRWAWEDYYGWTWISSDPWGWAPYHYGRWFYGSPGWCWFPGAQYERHYWSPALVAFFGFGGYSGFHSGFGFGNVGWVPLAPYERFSPWWGRGYGNDRGYGNNRGFGNNTTIINNTNIVNTYRNARVGNGVSGVNSADFGRRGGQYVGVNGQGLRDAGLVRGGLPVSPDRSSLRMADREVRSGAFPQSHTNQFYSRGGNSAQSSQRTPFDQQQRSGGQNTGGWNRSGDVRNSGTQGPSQGGSHAWRSFGEPVHSSQGGSSPQGGSTGWQGSSRSAVPAAGNGNRGGSWSRFGGTSNDGGSRNSQGGSRTAPDASTGGWGRNNAARGGSAVQASPSDRSGNSGYNAGRGTSSRSYGGGGEAVRINPPIVRDRSSGSSGNGGGGSDRSPSTEGGGSYRGQSGNGGGGSYRSPSSGGGGSYRAPSGGGGGGSSRAPSGSGSSGGGSSNSGHSGGRR